MSPKSIEGEFNSIDQLLNLQTVVEVRILTAIFTANKIIQSQSQSIYFN